MRTLLTILPLAAHLIAMNIAAAGPLACAWLAGVNSISPELSRRVARQSILALLVGVCLGGLLLVSPSDGMLDALARFPKSMYWFAAAELAFSLGCMAVLVHLAVRERRRPAWMWIIALATASNLLYHFPPLMAAISKLAVEPWWARDSVISRRVLLGLSGRPEVLSLWLHFVLASISGAAIFALCTARPGGQEDDAALEVVVRRLAAAALISTLLQLPVGAWVLLASSSKMQDAMLGQDGWATFCFAAGVLLAIGLLQSLAAIAAGDTRPAARVRAAGLFVAIALSMAATLILSRASAATRPIGDDSRVELTSSQAL